MSSSTIKTILSFIVGAVVVTFIVALLFPAHPLNEAIRSGWRKKPTPAATPRPREPNKIQETKNTDTFIGIGVTLVSRGGLPSINRLMIGKPAHKAGIQVDDVIQQIDGVSVGGLSAQDVIAKLQGEAGTTVVLTVYRPVTHQNLTIPVVREEIDPSAVSYLCGDEPVRGFGTAWRNHPEIRYWLDCPFIDFKQKEHPTVSTFQRFEHGLMLWFETESVEIIPAIYVLYNDTHTYRRYDDAGELIESDSEETPEAEAYKLAPRFAKIYRQKMTEEEQKRLGQAAGDAHDSQAAFQEFMKGRMFWLKETDRIYVVYDGNYDPDADGQFTRMRGWMSFEDIFEDNIFEDER